MSKEDIWYQKSIAIIGISSNMSIALGIGLIALGATLALTESSNFVVSKAGLLFIPFGLLISCNSAIKSSKKIWNLKYGPNDDPPRKFLYKTFKFSWHCKGYEEIH